MVPAALLTAEGRVSPLWLVGLFFLQTVGELFLSPVGLSTMTKLAPASLVGLVLGVWFLAAAWGNKLAGVLGGGFTATDAARARRCSSCSRRRCVGVATLAAAAAGAMAQAADGRRALSPGLVPARPPMDSSRHSLTRAPRRRCPSSACS